MICLNSPYGKANTIEELAKEIDVPVDELKKSVDSFNKAVDSGELSKLTPPNSYKKPQKIEKAPFYAVPYSGGMTATFGGPLINSKAEVQNLERKTIPGLYAAGNAPAACCFRDTHRRITVRGLQRCSEPLLPENGQTR